MEFLSTKMIAKASFQQIDSSTKQELINACKLLKVKGYSKLRKADIALLVFDASDIERQAITVQATAKEIEDKKVALRQQRTVRQSIKGDHPITVGSVRKLLTKEEGNLNIVIDCLYEHCRTKFADMTVAKNCTKRLKQVLQELSDELDITTIETLTGLWQERVRGLTYARRAIEQERTKQYVTQAEKTVDSDAVMEWARTNFTSNNQYHLAVALAITSGRRLIEIYGHTKFSKDGDFIYCEGLAKAKEGEDTARFLPLIPAENWLEGLSRLQRGDNLQCAKQSLRKLVSRNFPGALKTIGKDNGLEKFKDCRDFYAATIFTTAMDMYPQIRNAGLVTSFNMGHAKQESTEYYKKYDVKVMDAIKSKLLDYCQTL